MEAPWHEAPESQEPTLSPLWKEAIAAPDLPEHQEDMGSF